MRDYTQATAYLDMRYLPDELAEWTPEELVRAPDYSRLAKASALCHYELQKSTKQ